MKGVILNNIYGKRRGNSNKSIDLCCNIKFPYKSLYL